MVRHPGLVLVVVSVLTVSTACGSGDEAGPDRPAPQSSSSGGCVGEPGDIHLLQGPANNVGAGLRLGITSIEIDDDPPTAGLAVVDGEPAGSEVKVSVGDVVTLGSRDYTVSRICASAVDLDQGSVEQ